MGSTANAYRTGCTSKTGSDPRSPCIRTPSLREFRQHTLREIEQYFYESAKREGQLLGRNL